MRADYVPHSHECLERGVMCKCCSNVLRSLHAYGVVLKAVRTYVCVRRAIQRTCVAHDVRSHTYNRERGQIHPCIRTCMPTHQIQTSVHALHVYLPSFQCTTQKHIPCTNMPHYYALMRTGYVLHSLECLERVVMGKCCSNVLRSLRTDGVPLKSVRTYVCEKSDTAHDVRSHTYNRERGHIHLCIRACRVHALHVYLSSFQCTTQ
jgi:hypothetical protein